MVEVDDRCVVLEEEWGIHYPSLPPWGAFECVDYFLEDVKNGAPPQPKKNTTTNLSTVGLVRRQIDGSIYQLSISTLAPTTLTPNISKCPDPPSKTGVPVLLSSR